MKKILSNSLLSLAIFTLGSGCAISFKKPQSNLPPKSADEISVMSFNVENLFDTEHDANHEDETYLPLSKKTDPQVITACNKNDSASRRHECLTTNYTQEALEKKLANVGSVVMGVDDNGPDVLMLVEIENDNVLAQLNKKYLAKGNYQTQVLIQGPDVRGINVGFLSRFPLVRPPVLHQIDWKPKNDEDKKWMFRSRNILEVTVKVPNGDAMTFFVAHFPSQSNPLYWRQQAADNLTKLVLSKGEKDMVIAAGDFNITHDEEQEAHLFSETMAKAGAVSHLVGCQECPGTHFYRKSWSFLDAQIYNKALLPEGVGSYQLEPNTIDVIRYNEVHLKRGKYPKRWDLETQSGVSDHFPLYSRLKKRSEAKTPVVPPPPEPNKAAVPEAPTTKPATKTAI